MMRRISSPHASVPSVAWSLATPVLAIDGKTDVRVDHAQRSGDLGAQIVRVIPSIEPTHELGTDPLLRQVVIGARRSWCVIERHRGDGANRRLPVTPSRPA